MTDIEFDPLLKVATVAKMFEVRPYTIRQWIKDGKLKAVRLDGGHYRVYQSEVRRYANEKYGEVK